MTIPLFVLDNSKSEKRLTFGYWTFLTHPKKMIFVRWYPSPHSEITPPDLARKTAAGHDPRATFDMQTNVAFVFLKQKYVEL